MPFRVYSQSPPLSQENWKHLEVEIFRLSSLQGANTGIAHSKNGASPGLVCCTNWHHKHRAVAVFASCQKYVLKNTCLPWFPLRWASFTDPCFSGKPTSGEADNYDGKVWMTHGGADVGDESVLSYNYPLSSNETGCNWTLMPYQSFMLSAIL